MPKNLFRDVRISIPVIVIALLACFVPAHAWAQGPVGPYIQFCKNVTVDKNDKMSAQCQDFFGNTVSTALPHLSACKTDFGVWSVDGQLRCVESARKSESGRDYFDIISINNDTKNAFGETKVWLIEHPDVIAPQTIYQQVAFKAGDVLSISAGGCVQTGGSGNTWKSYTNPSGDDADHLYSGLIQIPTVFPSLIRIGGAGGTRFIPLDVPPTQLKELKLTLGYQDDGYGDNGYYSHDNGNNNQCLNVGPAFVMVTVESRSMAAQHEPKYSPHSKDFDLTWDTNGEYDANGFPVNPEWAHQIDHRGDVQDFNTVCGGAFSEADWPSDSTTIDEGKLASSCTSQAPTTDLSTNGFDQFFTICRKGFIPGHLNWGIETYKGPIFWNSYSGDWPQDHDYNFWLQTPAKAALTNESPLLELEMDGEETVDHFSNPWWQQVIGSRDDATITAAIGGRLAMVTGVIGIDGAHGDGHTESHPILSMAVLLSQSEDKDGIDERWVYFLRNSGDEGDCSHMMHTWAPDGNAYYVSLPWPSPYVTDVKVTDSHFWKDETTNVETSHGIYPGWTYLKFASGDADIFFDGEITLHYQKTAGAPPRKRDPNAPNKQSSSLDRDEPRWTEIARRFPDSATQTQFMADLTKAKPATVPVHQKRVRASIDPAIKNTDPPSLAQRDRIARAKAADDLKKKMATDATQPLLEKYRALFPKPPDVK